jgi:hypothetical protein
MWEDIEVAACTVVVTVLSGGTVITMSCVRLFNIKQAVVFYELLGTLSHSWFKKFTVDDNSVELASYNLFAF